MVENSNEPGGNAPRVEDLRAAPRFTLLLRAAKLVCAAGEFLCVLRDASATGLKAKVFHKLPECDGFELELGNGDRHPVELVWERDDHAGFRFAAGEIDVHSLMEERSAYPKRQLRLQIEHPAQIVVDGVARVATMHNISQNGAMVEISPPLAIGQQVRLEVDTLPLLHARVRWRRGNNHGLVIQEGFRLDELAQAIARLQLGNGALARRSDGVSHDAPKAALTGSVNH